MKNLLKKRIIPGENSGIGPTRESIEREERAKLFCSFPYVTWEFSCF